MKDDNDPLKIVIVRDMWLTGFDVPSLQTIYIDKPMKGHNLMQAIALELASSIRKNMSIDWNLREAVRAKMRVKIKRLLKKYKYPPDQQPKAIKTVMEQAELMCQDNENGYVQSYRDTMKQSEQMIQDNVVDYGEYKEGEEKQSLPKVVEDGEESEDKGNKE